MNHVSFANSASSVITTDSSPSLSEWAAEFWDEALTFVQSQQFGWTNGFCQRRILQRFQSIQRGAIKLHHADTVHLLGDKNAEDQVSIGVQDPRFYSRILTGGTIGAADSYIANEWSTNDLTKLIRILIRNMQPISGLEKTWSRLQRSFHRMAHRLRKNTKEGSRKNIHEHYDLGNEFYQLFLDRTMNYSSGIFESPSSDLYDASVAKMDRVCQKLRLQKGEHVVEIGTGWGGLAIHMAEVYGCRVTTTTISEEQFQFATARVRALGLEDRITVLRKDYRDLTGTYDKLVSIEMIEAVGHQFFDQYFAKCSSLLRPNGLMLIQAITMSEQNYKDYIRGVDFIRTHVFPGGCLPSQSAIGKSLGRVPDLQILDVDDHTEHYATTLRHWRQRFHGQLPQVRALGFDDAFLRLWHFYLCYCEAGFAERRIQLIHTTFIKPSA